MNSPRVLVEGEATGDLVVFEEPLSFWGGLDSETGDIIDVRHPQHGANIAGKIIAVPHSRGSSSSSSVLAEAIRAGNGPSAIILAEPDEIVVLGAHVAGVLYDVWCPVLVADQAQFDALKTGDGMAISGSDLIVTS